jgi:hypothetical protein
MPTAMSTFDSKKEGLQDLLRDIHDCKIQLPDFQRDWRWDDDHIKSLLASVSLSYPIGSVLLMETGGPDGRFAPRPLDGVQFSPPPPLPQRLILDGQQRLTALYRVLRSGQPVATRDARNNVIRRWYYLDIQQALDPTADREDAIVSISEDRQVRNFRNEVLADYTDSAKECEAGLFPLALAFDIAALFAWLDLYTQPTDPVLAASRRALRDRFVAEVISRVQQYQVPVIELRSDTPKPAVCQVFEKVNTGGVSLTVFELVTASFSAEGYQLRRDWEARERRFRTDQNLKTIGDLTSSDFLTAVALLSTYERRQQTPDAAVSCKRRDILQLRASEYLAVADRLSDGFALAARFLIRQKIFQARDVPYHTQLIPLAAILTALGSNAEPDTAKARIARWLWCGVLGELYGGAIETRFSRDLPEVVDWIRGGPEPSTIRDASFPPQRLLSLRSRGSAAYKGLHALLMREGGLDFRTGDPIDLQTYFDDSIDIHHIFPRRVCESMAIPATTYNSIVNKAPLSARTNRIIGGEKPSVYLPQLQRVGSMDQARMDSILRSHLILPAHLRHDRFQPFFDARLQAILGLIANATGKPLQAITAAGLEEPGDGDDLDE